MGRTGRPFEFHFSRYYRHPLALDEFNGVRGEFYKKMFARCPAHRPGTADEVANVAELLMSNRGAFITGSDFLVDGGATAAYFYGSNLG